MVTEMQISTAPAEVLCLFYETRDKLIDQGQSMDRAERNALKVVNLAGWFKVKGGWKQLGPDVREKVNVRTAAKQPDGTWVVEDIDAFYPNAVKGVRNAWTAEDIRNVIANTNKSIADGSQQPGLVEGHGQDLNAMGMQAKPLGFAVNWRESQRHPGWAACDLVGVTDEAYRMIRDKKLPGLSAKIIPDAGRLNARFQHVALLGGDISALSRLPTLELMYSATASNQLCFSASPEFLTKGNPPMKLSDSQRKLSGQMAACYSAMAAAYAAADVGEPGHEDKLAEAHQNFEQCKGQFDAAGEPEAPPVPVDQPAAPISASAEHPDEDQDRELIEKLLAEEKNKPADGSGVEAPPPAEGESPQFSADERRAALSTLAQLKAQVTAAIGEVTAAKAAQSKAEFSAYLSDLQAKGYQFSADDEMSTFSADEGNPAVVNTIKARLAKATRAAASESLAAIGQVLPISAAVADRPGSDAQFSAEAERSANSVRDNTPGNNFDPAKLSWAARIALATRKAVQ